MRRFFIIFIIASVTAFILHTRLKESAIQLPIGQAKKITLTLDRELQEKAEKILISKIERMKKDGHLPKTVDLAFVCLDNQTGAVLAYIPALPPEVYDFALSDKRDTGSVFKPLFYAIAIDTDAISPSDTFMDSPTRFPRLDGKGGTYTFKNFGDIYENRLMTVEEAIADSKNVVMLKVYHRTDRQMLSQKLNALGVPLESRKTDINLLPVSWTLNLVEVASAFTTLAGDGWRTSPRFVAEQPVKRTPVFSPETCRLVLRGMQRSLTDGTGVAAKDLSNVARAKTGSSYDSIAVLQTRKVTLVLRVGNRDSNKDIKKTGGKLALPLLAEYLREIIRARPELAPVWE